MTATNAVWIQHHLYLSKHENSHRFDIPITVNIQSLVRTKHHSNIQWTSESAYYRNQAKKHVLNGCNGCKGCNGCNEGNQERKNGSCDGVTRNGKELLFLQLLFRKTSSLRARVTTTPAALMASNACECKTHRTAQSKKALEADEYEFRRPQEVHGVVTF